MGHRLLGFGITLIMDYMDNRYKSCDYGRFFGFKIATSKKQKVLFDYANTTPVMGIPMQANMTRGNPL